jgi:hypothetical protein
VERLTASFRDPGGFVFRREGVVYRQINHSYAANYGRLFESGLYADLVGRGLLVSHEEVKVAPAEQELCFKVIRPRAIPFISHPYEWCFSQLKDAALLTLDIQETALRKGMSLKDASAFNIQFEGPRPVHIDTLSFTTAETGPAWIAYRQFCQHFLAPLALMSWRDASLGRLLALHPEGVPLDLTCRLLPRRAFWHFHRWVHLWLHNLGQRKVHQPRPVGTAASQGQRLALVDSLRSAIASLAPRGVPSDWSQYEATLPSYSAGARAAKESAVRDLIAKVCPRMVWDLGCNTGTFSQMAADLGAYVVASDYDHDCIEALYRRIRRPHPSILPLIVDYTNPPPALGWAGRERQALLERGPADLALALAVVHHWALGNNVPLPMIADFFAACTRHLVIEFVPKADPMSRRILAAREDIFPDYDQIRFEAAFLRHFDLQASVKLPESERVLYHFTLRPS